MITLFVSNEELIASLILAVLLVLYGWSKYSLAKHIELDAQIRNMSDEELIERFNGLIAEYEQKATYWKGQELAAILSAREKRELLKNVSDADLIDQFIRLKADYEKVQTFWKRKELLYYKKEIEKRKLA